MENVLVLPPRCYGKAHCGYQLEITTSEKTSVVDKGGIWDVVALIHPSLMVSEPTSKAHLLSPPTGEEPATHPRSAASVSRRMLLVLLSRTTLLTSLP